MASLVLLRSATRRLRPLTAVRRWCSGGGVAGARFSEQHEWARKDAAGTVTVGVSQFAVEALGEVVFAQLPEVGSRVERGEACGALESVKAASELYSPISGEVTDSNAKAAATPSLINKDCYGDGWLFKLRPDDPAQVDSLMTEERYQKFVAEEAH